MLVWPGLRLIGVGGKIPNKVFVAVAAVEPEHVRLDNGLRLRNQELLRATRLSHAVTYASCQGLTLKGRVRLEMSSAHLSLRHPPVRRRLAGHQLNAARGGVSLSNRGTPTKGSAAAPEAAPKRRISRRGSAPQRSQTSGMAPFS